MRSTIEMVQEFHDKFVDARDINKVKLLRPMLIREELKELNDAYWNDDKVAMLDGLTDTQYVLDGTFIVYDISKPDIGVGWFTKHEYDSVLLFEALDRFTHCARSNDVVGMMVTLHEMQWRLDSAYIALGMAHLKQPAFEEVHRSNMAKVDANGSPLFREDGKILKPEGWQPPDLKSIIEQDTDYNPDNHQ